ncbi:hypothetical protein TNCV_4056771 [Trichonephila clavipes]|nr:hypothetical protein TNCV_4056771 [Trichonephila clavipes]
MLFHSPTLEVIYEPRESSENEKGHPKRITGSARSRILVANPQRNHSHPIARYSTTRHRRASCPATPGGMNERLGKEGCISGRAPHWTRHRQEESNRGSRKHFRHRKLSCDWGTKRMIAPKGTVVAGKEKRMKFH